MSNDPKAKMTWKLTLLTGVGYSSAGDIEYTPFHYGRTSDELEHSPPQTLPSGLLHVLKESEMAEQALEAGFEIDICSAPQSRDEGWFRFEMGVIATNASSRLTREQGVYVSDEGPHSVELIHVNPCCPSRLPPVIWIWARELPENSLAWVIDSDLWDSGDGGQTSLHDFSDIGEAPTPNAEGPLPLPGPPDEPYEFV
jgi:hypothetical protein